MGAFILRLEKHDAAITFIDTPGENLKLDSSHIVQYWEVGSKPR